MKVKEMEGSIASVAQDARNLRQEVDKLTGMIPDSHDRKVKLAALHSALSQATVILEASRRIALSLLAE